MNICQRCINVMNLGQMRYAAALHIQNQCAKSLLEEVEKKRNLGLSGVNNDCNKLILVEHNPVYTVGLRQKNYAAETLDKLRALGADVEMTNRGGLITFHGPGQLVAYPIIYLKEFQVGMRQYIEQLETVIINTCAHFGINATRSSDTGVWVDSDKIAAIGK